MQTPKRYSPSYDVAYEYLGMEVKEDGEYVDWEDYKTLKEEYEKIKYSWDQAFP